MVLRAVAGGLSMLLASSFGTGTLVAQDAGGAALPREFRAAWVATVNNIDWPSAPGLPVTQQQQELTAILDRAAEVGLNALILQVRPQCDAFYPSRLEPWSEFLTGRQGRAPKPAWDPLAFAVEGAHARGMQLHAWFNPYRAKHAEAKSPLASDHVSRTMPQAVVEYGGHLWLDPGNERARAHTLAVIADVVERYDIDGVHIDDYFYPYPSDGKDFPDYDSYRRYRRGGGKLERDDWRRANVDELVQSIDETVHRIKPWVLFGISPFGVARPHLPPGIEAGVDQYAQLYADVRKWAAKGWCDYLAPQLYWPIDQKAQSYTVLLAWWAQQLGPHMHLWPGNFSSRAGSRWPISELIAQVERTRAQSGATGNIHFSMKALMGKVGDALRDGPYAERALVPASPWLDAQPPAVPVLDTERRGSRVELSWGGDDDVLWWVVLHRSQAGEAWHVVRTLPAKERRATVDVAATGDVGVAALDAAGNASAVVEAR